MPKPTLSRLSIAASAALLLSTGLAMGASSPRATVAAGHRATEHALPAAFPVKVASATLTSTALAAVAGKRATVLIFVGVSCPITNQYAPEIAAMAAKRGSGVQFVRVYSGAGASAETARKHAAAYGLTALPAIIDADGSLARGLGATVTPEAFVLDAGRTVRYAGRIDDRFADRGVSRTSGAASHDLAAAVNSLLAGRAIAVARTRAIGCAIEAPTLTTTTSAVAAVPTGPTYAHDVAGIVQANCVSCHRAGQIGPMPLETYAQVKQFAANIAAVTEKRQMPPWKPVPGCGDFTGERRLTDSQIATLTSWSKAGAPAGDLTKTPAEPTFTQGWTLGKPDLVLTMPTTWRTEANAEETYRCFVLPTGLTENKEVVAIEYRPGNRSVVHHCLGYVDTQGRGRARDGKDGKPGYTSFGGPGFLPTGEIGGWAPGNLPAFLPDGIARALPAGSDIVLQMHYHPTGKVEDDKTEIGIYFAKKPITKHLRTMPIFAPLSIPAGDAAYHTGNTFKSPVDADIISVTPHMHLLARKVAMTVKQTDGTVTPLIQIDDWDFNWQGTYTYKKPIHINKGAVVTLDADYDNSTANPHNPNSPPKHVGWGERTSDEMCIGFISYVADDENDPSMKLFDAIMGGKKKQVTNRQ